MTIVFACLSKAADENVGMKSKRESNAKLLGSYVRYPGCQLQPPCATPSHLCNTQINLCAMISSRPFFFPFFCQQIKQLAGHGGIQISTAG